MSTKHCPYCNNDVVDGRCTYCDYKGPGLTTAERSEQNRGAQLGDMTGEPRNNGWADGPWGDNE